MPRWVRYPYPTDAFVREPAALRRRWARLHASDAEPAPRDAALLAAWGRYHAGELRGAFDAALALGPAGATLANKAQAIQASYLERNDDTRLAMLAEVATRAAAQQRAEPSNPAAWFWQAYALGRRAEQLDVMQVVAEGLAGKVRTALEKTLALQPRHADAELALATWHAEAIARVGRLLAMTQGADAAKALHHYRRALALHPKAIVGRVEFARGLTALEGDRARAEARRLLAEAVKIEPLDATERLEHEAAKAALAAAG